ncbi:type II toxin-antitoxin system HicA family toxin [Brachyspira intermedia]
MKCQRSRKILYDNGFILDRQKGSHRIYKKNNN